VCVWVSNCVCVCLCVCVYVMRVCVCCVYVMYKMQWKKILLEWWRLISEKRCDVCAHSQEDDYNEALKEFL